MIKIKLSTVFSNDYTELFLEVYGDLIIINGEEFDFTDLPKSYHMEAKDIESEWFVNTVYKLENGDMEITLRFPHPYDADDKMKFPELITVTDDGFVDLPKYTPPVVIEHTTPEVIENEEIRLLEIETNTNPYGLGSVGDSTIVEGIPSGN